MNLKDTFDVILKKHQTLEIVDKKLNSWNDVILYVVHLMAKAQLVKLQYADDIINATKKFGPYYIVAENVAMPHATSENNVLNNGYGMLILKHPVLCGDQKVQVVICLAATSPDFHVAVSLPQIAALFDDPQMDQKLINAKTNDEIFDIIASVDFTKYLN